MGITPDMMSPNISPATDSTSNRSFGIQEADNISFSEGFGTCCVGIIDMVNSTRVTAGLTRYQMGKYYCLFINWATAVITGYGGKVVKNTGDGLLFYFPLKEGSENTKQIRDCLNSGIAMSTLQPNINMKFHSEELPELNYRISLDYGEVNFARTMASTTLDIFSTTVNICAKINCTAAPNAVVIGGDLYQVAKNLSGFDFQQIKKTIAVSDRPYPIYSVSEAKSIREYLVSKKRIPVPMARLLSNLNTENEVKIA